MPTLAERERGLGGCTFVVRWGMRGASALFFQEG